MERENLAELSRMAQAHEDLPVYALEEEFLIGFLRARKGKVDRAFASVKAYCKLKSDYPQWFLSSEDMPAAKREQVAGWRRSVAPILDKKDEQGRTIVALFLAKHTSSRASFDTTMTGTVQICEELTKDESVHRNGIIILEDLHGLSLMGSSSVHKDQRKLFFHLLHECLPLRVVGVHAIRGPWYAHILFNLVRPFISKKMRARYHSHSAIDAVTKKVEKHLLPTQMGGTNPPRKKEEEPDGAPPVWRKSYIGRSSVNVGAEPVRLA